MKAIETAGSLDKQHRLVLDDYLEIPTNTRLKVIVLIQEQEDISEKLWLTAAAGNPAFQDLGDPAEDIYSSGDGRPFRG